MIRILNVEPSGYSKDARRILDEVGIVDERELQYKDIVQCIAEYDALIIRLRWCIDRTLLKAATRLKVIVTATTGLDHIDLDAATEYGISVLSLKGQTEFLRSIVATAEHTWALLLTLTRRIPWAFQSVITGDWNRDLFKGRDLNKQRLGILGLGRIGEKVARYGLAFGMKVFAYDPYTQMRLSDVLMCDDLDSLLAYSDVLCIHVPLNDETRHMIGVRELAQLPHGALLINTARGAVIEEAALLDALDSGRLAGAALDVIEDERVSVSEYPLVIAAQTRNNLIITPHIAGATHEAMAATEIFMAEQLRHFVNIRS